MHGSPPSSHIHSIRIVLQYAHSRCFIFLGFWKECKETSTKAPKRIIWPFVNALEDHRFCPPFLYFEINEPGLFTTSTAVRLNRSLKWAPLETWSVTTSLQKRASCQNTSMLQVAGRLFDFVHRTSGFGSRGFNMKNEQSGTRLA